MNDMKPQSLGQKPVAGIGDNSGDRTITVEVRLFNGIGKYAGPAGWRRTLEVPVGTAVADLARRLGIPLERLFLVLVNGKDITPGLVGDAVKAGHQFEDGDVIAFSGPVPYSYGYGAPVV